MMAKGTRYRRALVSDHAIVRYIERILQAPELVDSIVADLLADGRDRTVTKIKPQGVIKTADNRMEIICAGGRVVSVVAGKRK